MSVRFNTSAIKDRMRQRVTDILITAGDLAVGRIKEQTPVITGNLINSTFRSSPGERAITVHQNAEYALWVELRRFHFSYGLEIAKVEIKYLLKQIKI